MASLAAIATLTCSQSARPGQFQIATPKSGQHWPAIRATAIDAAGANGAVTLRGALHDVTIGPVRIHNAYRAVRAASSAVLSRITIRDLDARVGRSCIALSGDRLVIRDTQCVMTGGPQHERRNMPFGLHVSGGRGLIVENSRFDKFQWAGPDDRYWNGDGVTIEQGVSGARLRNVSANGNTDAGFDIKPPARLDRTFASDNCRNYRFWNSIEAGTLTAGDVRKRGGVSSCAAIWIHGSDSAPPRVHIASLVVRMKRPGTIMIIEDGPAQVFLDSCDISAPARTTLVHSRHPGTRLRLGPGCAPGQWSFAEK
ncbi:MAG: hypothetical protein ABIQ32_07860 [Sphingomicrobium sp.]